jgi:hypothetical protein
MPVIEGYPHAYGGGIFCSSDSTLAISNSIITGNESKGGVWVSDASMSGSVACNSYGGGIYISSGSTGSTIENCLIVNNETVFVESEWYEEPNHGTSRGAGICCGSGVGVTIRNCTFSGNFTYPTSVEGRGGAIYGPATAVDNIIWGNLSVNQIQGAINLSYSDIEGGWSGAGSNNIDQDPCFVGGPEGDYYLSQISASQGVTSPCVDAGSDSAFNLGLDPSTTRTDTMVDIGFVDMGYHYQTDCINGPDIDKDGDVDFLDYAYLANQFQTGPNEPNADIWPVCGDGFVDSNDLALLFEHWLEGFPYPNKATNPSPSDEVNGVSPFVVVSWSAGDYALSRDVYFGTDFNDVNDAGFHDPAFMGNQTGTSWDTNDYNNSMLEYLTTYYWRIDEKNQRGRKKGDVWSFTTGGEPNEHLEAWWKFDEGSDVEVYDSADGHNGTLIGDPSWVAGKIGDYALEFDGAGDCVDTNDFDLPNNFTISLWINPASTNDGQCFIGKHSSDGANKFLFGFWHGGYNVRLQTDVYRTGVKTTGWQHLAVVASQKDASHTDVTVYKNGDILWSHTFDDIAGDMSGKAWTIGQEWDSNTRTDFFNGTIDDVRIYNRHLGGEEIELIYLEGAE